MFTKAGRRGYTRTPMNTSGGWMGGAHPWWGNARERRLGRDRGGSCMDGFRRRSRFVRLLVACSLFGLFASLLPPPAVGAASGQTIDGIFATIDGDPQPGVSGAAREVYFVTDAQGNKTQLIL